MNNQQLFMYGQSVFNAYPPQLQPRSQHGGVPPRRQPRSKHGGVPRHMQPRSQHGGVPRHMQPMSQHGGVPRHVPPMSQHGGVPPHLQQRGQHGGVPPRLQHMSQQVGVLANSFPVYLDVKFRRLEFFDTLCQLQKPSKLVPHNSQRRQRMSFGFCLTPQQATEIAETRDIRPGVKYPYIKQAQLRFCMLQNIPEQEDCFPPNVIVAVNNTMCPLPNPIPPHSRGAKPKRPPGPVNITPLVKLSPIVNNKITIQWAINGHREYAVEVTLVQQLTSQDLLQRLKEKEARHSEITRHLIIEKLRDADSEITTTCLKVSLICPLGKTRMSTACRPITCKHLQCFDLLLFLQMNERRSTWLCPICKAPAQYANLVIDEYFQEILESPNLPTDVNEIQLHKDGSWSTDLDSEELSNNEKSSGDVSIEMIEDNLEAVSSGSTATSSTDKATKDKSKKKLADLTASDSDDDVPLAKRKPVNVEGDSTIMLTERTRTLSINNASDMTSTPGPSSVQKPVNPAIIFLDSPSSPRSTQHNNQQSQPPSSMTTNQNGASLSINSLSPRSGQSSSQG